MADFEVRGVEDFRNLAAKFKGADKPLRLRFNRELRAAMKPTIQAIKASAAADLPKSGGLAAEIAASKVGVQIRQSGNNPGVRVQAKSKHAIGGMNKGRLRHPVFGNTSVWVTQAIKPGWWDDPVKKAHPQAVAAAQRALDGLAKELD